MGASSGSSHRSSPPSDAPAIPFLARRLGDSSGIHGCLMSELSARAENKLLARLSVKDYERLIPVLERVTLKPKHVVYKVRSEIDYVYFPTHGIISAMTIMGDGSAIEVATIGSEGMCGLSAFNGAGISPYEVIVQIAGQALRMEVSTFTREAQGCLRDTIVRYSSAFSVQVSYSVACNGLHKIEQRLCHWLLMTQDRVRSNVLPLTHEFLAIMLGVRRASITEILQPLQKRGVIEGRRGNIEVVDREQLEKLSCECYRA